MVEEWAQVPEYAEAMRQVSGRRFDGLQFHPEVTAEMVDEWAEVPEYTEAMRRMRARAAGGPFAGDPADAAALAGRARTLYANFRALIHRPAPRP